MSEVATIMEQPAVRLSAVDRLEMRVLDAGVPLLELPTTHRFTPGLYVREVVMPAGTFWTTRRHLTEHPFVVSAGRCTVYNEQGDVVQEISAPHTGITKPGTRRCILVHEATTWTTFHPTGETDVEKLEGLLVEPYPQHATERHSLQPSTERKAITI